MKHIFIIAVLFMVMSSCTKDAKQTKWKVEVVASEPVNSVYVQAGLKGGGELNEGTGENYNQTDWELEFTASKSNTVKVIATSSNPGDVTIRIFMKGKLKKEQTFTNSGPVSQHSLVYQN